MKFTEISTLFYARCNNEISQVKEFEFTFDLQLFDEEKTEDPTAKRLGEARKKGQVAKSQELNSVFIIMTAFVVLHLIGGSIYAATRDYTIYIFTNLPENITVPVVMNLFMEVVVVLAQTAFPVMIAIMLMGLVINIYQVGFNFTTEPLSMDITKLNPISGLGRMFSKRALVELVKSILKIIIVGYFIQRFLLKEALQLPKLIYLNAAGFGEYISNIIYDLAMQLCLVLFILAVFDWSYQKWQHKKSLKMSKHDIKEESKQSEGDPLIKGKIKQKQRAMAMQRMMQEVPKADVIITNPTHFAVALKYESGMTAPIVVAKGQDAVALRIKAIAREAKVAIVENKVLARALYSTAEIGDMVPPELYKSVAEVLAYVYRLKKKVS